MRFEVSCSDISTLPMHVGEQSTEQNRRGEGLAVYCSAAVTLHTVLPTSSAISKAPVLSIATPTGRPRASPFEFKKPVTTSSALPFGRPPLNGTNTTLYPLSCGRSQLPCSPTKAPPRYFFGRLS